MNLKNFSNQELLSRIERLAKSERKITHLVLIHISEIESRRLYASEGYSSMYSYLTEKLGYSESSAYRRLQSARLLRQLPEVAEKIEAGSLNLSQLTQVQRSLKDSLNKSVNKNETLLESNIDNLPESEKRLQVNQNMLEKTQAILKKIENKSTFETQSILAKEFNQPLHTQEKKKPHKDESVTLTLNFTKVQYEELKMSESFLSHVCVEGKLSEVIYELAKIYNQKKRGVKKSGKPDQKMEVNKSSKPDQKLAISEAGFKITQSFAASEVELKMGVALGLKKGMSSGLKIETDSGNVLNDRIKSSNRKSIPITIKRKLLKKAQHTCEFHNHHTGEKCQSQYQLQVEHIQPQSLGGSDDISNLRILCRTHNLLMAERSGLWKM